MYLYQLTTFNTDQWVVLSILYCKVKVWITYGMHGFFARYRYGRCTLIITTLSFNIYNAYKIMNWIKSLPEYGWLSFNLYHSIYVSGVLKRREYVSSIKRVTWKLLGTINKEKSFSELFWSSVAIEVKIAHSFPSQTWLWWSSSLSSSIAVGTF